MSLADEIKAVMDTKGVTAYEIAKRVGLNQSVLSRYFNGKVAMSLKALDTLLDYLGYELTIRKKRKTERPKDAV
jgi:transcriptional regulator with XRE-family HTH domain